MLGAGRLGFALVGARSGDHREVAVDDGGVLDEDGVGAVVGRLDLEQLPALGLQRGDVAEPLAPRQLQVDRDPVEVGEQALGRVGDRAGGPARASMSTDTVPSARATRLGRPVTALLAVGQRSTPAARR